ncbi:hypothetical protein J4G37_37130, partial [Microvirga sp. 3-52]|nr:hypothetical protein [Microvirga sp. 3-52]
MKILKWALVLVLAAGIAIPSGVHAAGKSKVENFSEMTYGFESYDEQLVASSTLFRYDSGLTFDYPDAIRGVYVTGHSAGGARFETLVNLMETTDLNAMVIDIKDDYGNITYVPEDDSPLKGLDIGKPYIKNPRAMLEEMEEKQIYPIGRIVVFKDSVLAEKRPELSFVDNGEVWKNGRKEAFVNPFMKEVWDHNIEIAIEAAKMGFQEIQFDYVRFPEGFEKRHESLAYDFEDYKDSE